MSIHIQTGTGSPITNNTTGTPGCHYIDLDTGDHYLYGTTTWQMIGGGGAPAMNVVMQDASANATLLLNFNATDFLLYNAPASGNIQIDLSAVDPAGAIPNGNAHIMALTDVTPIELINSSYGAYVSAHDGITFANSILTPPAWAVGMLLRVKQLGSVPGFANAGICIEASALMFTSTGLN